jgi:Putative zinc-finger
MPPCSEIGLMLGAAGDGELEPDEMHEVARHLVRCASCTVELSDYSTIGRELRAVAVMPSLGKFTKSVLDLIGKLAVVAILAIALHSAAVLPTALQNAKAVPEVATSRPAATSSVMRSVRLVDVRVDSADKASSAFSHTNGQTQSGKMIVFSLPGGKTLHVRPRAVVGNMIAMEVVLFDGKRTAMTADLNLESGDTFALTGEQYGQGTLLIRISPTTATAASRGQNYSDRSPGITNSQAS